MTSVNIARMLFYAGGMMPNNDKNRIMERAADTTKSVHLSASAGSGKTRALKNRYLALLEQLDTKGLNSDQAVAITFTDKAAAEIKERVYRDLPEPLLKKIIRGSQDIRISTIHSFCMNLLKRYPLEAGLPPDFGILDARDQAYKIQQAIESALEESGNDPETMQCLEHLSLNKIISLLTFLLSIRSRLKRMEIDAGGQDRLIHSMLQGLDFKNNEMRIRELLASHEWQQSFEDMGRMLDFAETTDNAEKKDNHLHLAKEQDPDAVSRIAQSLYAYYFTQAGLPRKASRIAAKAFPEKKIFLEYDTLFFSIQDMLAEFRNLYARTKAGRETASLLTLYFSAEKRYTASKLREGLLDFDDLEIYTYQLLRKTESSDILYWLDRKILHFLVDEFQDTSDIQWAIITKLTEEIFSGAGSDKPMNPTLFVVGDQKQSIYRFREANYRLIDTIRDMMENHMLPETREILTLDTNYRSTSEIIETVNTVFSRLWDDYKPSECERTRQQGSVRLIELPNVRAQTTGDAMNGNESCAEPNVLAEQVQSMIREGIKVYEREQNNPDSSKSDTEYVWKERSADYGDCAILIPTRARLKEYETSLQSRGIPYRVVGGIGFYEEDEILALMNILFYLWNKDDHFALAGALKSVLFGFTDNDLSGLAWNSDDLVSSLFTMNPESANMFQRWSGLAGLVPLASLIRRIVLDTGAYILFGKKNPQAIFNIDKLIDTAHEFDRRGYTTLQDFVEWVKNIRETEQREATADMNLPGFQRSVSIMTVHKAKGLEYPIVFLPGMNQAAWSLSHGPEVLLAEADGRKRMAINRTENPLSQELWSEENGEQDELKREHQRLLYVAMTRARDHLVMIGTHAYGKYPIKKNTWLDFVHQTIPLSTDPNTMSKTGSVYSCPDWKERPLAKKQGEKQPLQEKPGKQHIDINHLVDNLSSLPYSSAPAWKNATDFIEQKQNQLHRGSSIPEKTESISPLIRGTVLHRCLESMTATSRYNLAEILKSVPEYTALEKTAQQAFKHDVESIIKSLIENNDLSWIFKQQESAYSELPILYKKGNTLISGIIDRVLIRDNTAFVIDYKAIRIEHDEALSAFINQYRPQIQLYTEAIKSIFGISHVEGYLLFLDSSRLQLVSRL